MKRPFYNEIKAIIEKLKIRVASCRRVYAQMQKYAPTSFIRLDTDEWKEEQERIAYDHYTAHFERA